MVVTSKFDSKGIISGLMLFLVAALAMVGGPMLRTNKLELVTKLIVVSIAEVVALLIWAIRLKVITVVDQFTLRYLLAYRFGNIILHDLQDDSSNKDGQSGTQKISVIDFCLAMQHIIQYIDHSSGQKKSRTDIEILQAF